MLDEKVWNCYEIVSKQGADIEHLNNKGPNTPG